MANAKKAQRGYIFMTDGRVIKVQPEKGTKFDYKELQVAVGGLITTLLHAPRQGWHYMYCNDEGLLKHLPPNPHTEDVVDLKVYRLNGYGPGWQVVGNIIGIKNEEVEDNEFPTVRAALRSQQS